MCKLQNVEMKKGNIGFEFYFSLENLRVYIIIEIVCILYIIIYELFYIYVNMGGLFIYNDYMYINVKYIILYYRIQILNIYVNMSGLFIDNVNYIYYCIYINFKYI